MKKIILLLLCSVIIFESCNTKKPACGGRKAHKQRHHKMMKSGLWM